MITRRRVGVLRAALALAAWLALPAGAVAKVAAVAPAAVVAAAAPTLAAHFSPWDDVEGELLRLLREARQVVRVQAYLLTSRNIARALVAARRRGLDVAVLADAEQAARLPEQLVALAAAGVAVLLETRYAAAHNKVVLIDPAGARPVVATGSYNFTWSAQARNAENLLVVKGDAALAARYLANWQRHRADAVPWPVAAAGPVLPAPTF